MFVCASYIPGKHNIIVYMCIHIRDHDTNEEVVKRTGIERLQDNVSIKIRKMAGHVLRLQRERPHIQQCTRCQKTA